MQSIFDFFGTIFHLITGLLDTVWWLITYLPKLAATVLDVVAFSPSFLVPLLTLSISLLIGFAVLRNL